MRKRAKTESPVLAPSATSAADGDSEDEAVGVWDAGGMSDDLLLSPGQRPPRRESKGEGGLSAAGGARAIV